MPERPYTLVVGLGASGLAAARHLSRRREPVVVIDSRTKPPGLLALEHEHLEAAVRLDTLDPAWLAGASRVVVSPGLALDLPLIAEARRRGLEVLGELELFARAATAPVLAVTGSNGKSTVTMLAAHLLRAQGFDAPAGGNLGPPALDLLEHGPVDAYVLEVSSFQLETTRSLKPRAAALLNVSPDHIDRHGSFERYAALKISLLEAAEQAIVNWDEPLLRPLASRGEETIPFSVKEPLSIGWSIVQTSGERWLAHALEPLIPSASLGLPGETGEANVLAALALIQCMDGDLDAAIAALPAFRGLPHRLQHVLVRDGVSYVDDSKGTNVGAAVAAITGARAPVVLIAGGRSKAADFGPLVEAARGRVRAALLLGEAAGQIAHALAGTVPTLQVADMRTAVAEAAKIARPGDWVLLSPACASQDMFADYRERGEAFATAVRSLAR
jgi:UDP-N-acetylmuramoylalanine--D-glutamate ligase